MSGARADSVLARRSLSVFFQPIFEVHPNGRQIRLHAARLARAGEVGA